MIGALLAACGEADKDESKLSIVTTIFPEYEWVREIVGYATEHVEYTILLDNGVDLHNYQPTAGDVLKISSCDMFIYVGGESDSWVDGALAEATNKDMVVIDLMDVLGDALKEEELKEGMEGEEEEEEGEEEEGPEYDEHIWLSLKNAIALCGVICDKLCSIDADHADAFRANAATYTAKLKALDEKYKAAVDSAENKALVFGDRFPFRYLFDDYGIDYYAAFKGCSAESEASFETRRFLANKIDELGLDSIMKIETSDGALAESIRESTGSKDQKILTLNSLQSVNKEKIDAGATYLTEMEKNLEVLKEALG
jgi:zinc transport system substrate-binding protein